MNDARGSVRSPGKPTSSGAPGALSTVLRSLHGIVILALVGVFVFAVYRFVQASSERPPHVLPSTMEAVDWTGPESTTYCLACHRTVGPAMAGLDVQHGHPQNVPLNADQRHAIADLGTIVGPDDTLICMSCHVLGGDDGNTFMLADTVTGGRLCEHCHPGHYARGTPHDLQISAPEERNRLGLTTAEGGPCSACHLAHRYARDFQTSEKDPDGRCITCHEIHGAAEAHARTTMDHPESRCLECHDPHDMTHGDFLKQPVDELCINCHQGYADGPVAGMHSVGPMDFDIPRKLIDAGAWTPEGSRQLTCSVCHAAHTSEDKPLLVMSADTNDLCLSCHPEQERSATTGGATPHHGESPLLSPAQRAVVASWGSRVGSDGQLLCLSCHRVHKSDAPLALLNFAPRYGEVCSACHPHHEGVVGSSHDLRIDHPGERNIAGLTALETGACGTCHLAHRYAREPVSTAGDPTGQCITCHVEGACAQEKAFADVEHPQTACTNCHNPHDRRTDKFLARSEPDLCLDCHTNEATLVGGPHDHSVAAAADWPDNGAPDRSVCLSCHAPHSGQRADLNREPAVASAENPDADCLACHADADWSVPTAIAAIHPRDIPPDQTLVDPTLVPHDASGAARMTCRTCHDPHGGAEPVHLSRVSPNEPTETLCLNCHVEKQYIRHTGHSSASLVRFGFDVDSCRPCHAMHANPDGAWGQMLSPRFLQESCDQVGATDDDCLPCLACHHADGPAPIRAVTTHPERRMFNIVAPDAPGYLPLFNRAGDIDPAGHVVCRTCHLSHGRLDLLERVAAAEDLSEAERSAIRTQVRPFTPPNICTECHGQQARALYLFFHDPQRRGEVRDARESLRP